MKWSYDCPVNDEEIEDTAEQIVQLLLSKGVTYKKASWALERTKMLLEETRPVKGQNSGTSDS